MMEGIVLPTGHRGSSFIACYSIGIQNEITAFTVPNLSRFADPLLSFFSGIVSLREYNYQYRSSCYSGYTVLCSRRLVPVFSRRKGKSGHPKNIRDLLSSVGCEESYGEIPNHKSFRKEKGNYRPVQRYQRFYQVVVGDESR